MLLGAIADDVTGGTDLASVLRRGGLTVVQTLDTVAIPPGADAVVVSLKIRTADPGVARSSAGQAAEALRSAGAEQIYFKYCSTFDSTDDGNIGPVIDELLARLHGTFSIACPAYPALARTVYAGHLFVGNQLLSESSMRHHPLTPMTDANLVRVLGRQTRSPVGLVELATVEAGPRAVASKFADLAAAGYPIAIVDALFDRHLDVIAEASAGLRLMTGGAAFGGALARVKYRPREPRENDRSLSVRAPVAMLSGSCSAATLAQIEQAAGLMPTREIDPLKIAENPDELPRLIDWACDQIAAGSVLALFERRTRQGAVRPAASRPRVGRGSRREDLRLARGGTRRPRCQNVRRCRRGDVGSRTAGSGHPRAHLRRRARPGGALGARAWSLTGYVFALKSGNFGSRNFFAKALERVR